MADMNSALPIRSELPGQVNYTDIIAKIGDGTNPTTQLLGVDTSGRITIKLDDGNGNIVTSQINGAQRALDVGINVSGVQIDPRAVGQYNSALPTVTSGNYTPLQTNVNGVLLTSPEGDLYPATQTITAQDSASTSTAVFAQTWYTGTPTAGSVASFNLSSNETGLVEVTGTWTGTLQFEESVDGGTTWIAHAIHVLGSPIFVSTVTGNVSGSLNLAAKTQFRVRATSAWTGTATIRLNLSINPSSVYIANGIKLLDASSSTSTVQANIVAGATAAGTANTAIVVGLSPNSPLPAGTNLLGSVNQGTSPWITKDESDGPVAPGTAASFSQLAGGIYNSSLPTLTAGQQAAIQLDSSGRLVISPLTSASVVTVSNLPTTVDTNYGTVGASTIRTASQIGNSTGAADFGAGATDAQTLRVSANQGTPGTTSTAWFQKVTDGTNVAAVKAASTAAIATDPALVVAISPNNTVAVTQSTSPWVTSDLADGSVSGGTAGTKSLLGGGIYNSSAPTLTTGQQASLQLDSSGNLNVDLKTSIPAGSNLIGAVNLDVGGSAVSNTNPVPVTITSTTPGTAIQSYYTSASLAAGGSATFTYTVAATHTFNFERVYASASGKIKVVVQNNGSTIFAAFNSTANPNVDITITAPPLIAAGNTASIIITNLDLIAFDVYGTIEGNQN